MTSSDREILLSIDGRVAVLGTRLDRLEAEVRGVREEQRLLRSEVASLTTAVYWVLGAIGVFLAALGIFTGIYLWLSDRRRADNPAPAPAPYIIQVPAYYPPEHRDEQKTA